MITPQHTRHFGSGAELMSSDKSHMQLQVPKLPGPVPLSDEDAQCLRLARILAQSGKPAAALQLLERLLAKSSPNAELLHFRGVCLEAGGNVPAAFASYMSAIAVDPTLVPAFLSVGALYKGRGLLLEALAALNKACELQPGDPAILEMTAVVLTDIGTKLKTAGSLQEGLARYQQAADLCPTYAPAYYNIGVVYSELRQFDRALECYERAVAVQPRYAQAHCNMGVIYKERGNVEAAVVCYEAALAACPNFQIVLNNMAIALSDLGTRTKMAGRVREGIALYERALTYNPKYADALYNLGVAFGETGQQDRAMFMYELAIHFNPACAEAYNNLGVLYKERDNLERAVECYTGALQLRPNFAQSLNNLGVVYTAQGRAQEALSLLTAAITACPTYAEAYNNLGVLQRDLGSIAEAIASYTRCLELAPDSRNAGQNRLLALNYIYPGEEPFVCAAHQQWGERMQQLFTPLPKRTISPHRRRRLPWTAAAKAAGSPTLAEASTAASAAAELAAGGGLGSAGGTIHSTAAAGSSHSTPAPSVHSPAALPANLIPAPTSVTGQATAGTAASTAAPAVAALVGAAGAASNGLTTVKDGYEGDRPLRIGYISPDLFTHSVSYFAEAPLAHHDPSRVRLYVYSCVPRTDAKTARLRALVEGKGGIWREVTHLPEPALAAMIREDEIDVLVELTGHTANNRLGVMALRPAPVQATWIGYPNSTGLAAVAYRFTDAVCDPLNTRQTFVEELVRLPGCFLCYTPSIDAPPVSPLPASVNGFITFGSFNNLAKITPQVIKMWAAILLRVPCSRLLLKNKPFACETARSNLLQRLAMEGIDGWRVDLMPLAAANQDHLATYSLMDLSLDPFPYAGTTTTCESLYMGVPVVTLAGGCHAHNVGVSLLSAVGLQNWVASTEAQYVELAVRHAADVQALAALRSSLRPRMLSSPLCDAPNFVRRLEDVYDNLWNRHLDSELASVGLPSPSSTIPSPSPPPLPSQPANLSTSHAQQPTHAAIHSQLLPNGNHQLDPTPTTAAKANLENMTGARNAGATSNLDNLGNQNGGGSRSGAHFHQPTSSSCPNAGAVAGGSQGFGSQTQAEGNATNHTASHAAANAAAHPTPCPATHGGAARPGSYATGTVAQVVGAAMGAHADSGLGVDSEKATANFLASLKGAPAVGGHSSATAAAYGGMHNPPPLYAYSAGHGLPALQQDLLKAGSAPVSTATGHADVSGNGNGTGGFSIGLHTAASPQAGAEAAAAAARGGRGRQQMHDAMDLLLIGAGASGSDSGGIVGNGIGFANAGAARKDTPSAGGMASSEKLKGQTAAGAVAGNGSLREVSGGTSSALKRALEPTSTGGSGWC